MRPRTLTWQSRALVVLLMVAGVLAIGGSPAQAHPFGDPQTVAVEAAGEVVTVEWRVGGLDDLTLLGIELGVLPPDRVMLDGAIMFEDGDTAAVSESEELRTYLLDRIDVVSDGAACAGDVIEVGDLAEDSARLEFTCAGPVRTASVTARMLTDLHPAYRTLATGPDGQRAVYETGADTHDFVVGDGTVTETGATSAAASTTAQQDVGRSAAAQLGAVGGAVLLIVVGGALVLRRRSRHRQSQTS